MSNLKSLTFTVIPPRTNDPKLARRERLIERLEEQRRLAKDPSYAPIIKRWKKDESGSRLLTDHARRIRAWWRMDPKGSVVLTVRSGFKELEIEKGKPGIVVGTMERLDAVLMTLIAATRAGELDALLEAHRGGTKSSSVNRKTAAA